MQYTHVLANLSPPRIFNFYGTAEAVQADNARANLSGAPYGIIYTPMTYEAYTNAERHYYLDRPAYTITSETFDEMLGALPPFCYSRQGDLHGFLMREFTSGTYTHQYVATADGRYFCKMVDATDRSTWMTRASLKAPNA